MTGKLFSDQEIADLKARNPCDVYAGTLVALRRKGGSSRGMIGPCPMHSKNPQARDSTSFECDAEKWKCAVCSDGGDVIKLAALVNGLDPKRDFVRAVELLGGTRQVDPERAAQLARERSAKAEKDERNQRIYRDKERGILSDIWEHALRFEGSPAADYMALRHVEPRDTTKFRCVQKMPYFLHGGKDAPVLHRGPAMVAQIVGRAGGFAGLHFTYVDMTKPKGKVDLKHPDDDTPLPAKKVRGSKRGGHIEIAAGGTAPEKMILGEGIEKVIAVEMALASTGRDMAGTALWVASDLGNIGGKSAGSVRHPTLKDARGRARRVPGPDPDLEAEAIAVPDSVQDLVLLGDSTSDRFTTACALYRAAQRYAKPGRTVRVAWAPPDLDFDELLGPGQSDGLARIAAIIDRARAPEHPAPPAAQDDDPDIDRRSEAAAMSGSHEASRETDGIGEPYPDDMGGAETSRSPGEPTGDMFAPRSFGFDVEALNEEYALVLMGSKAVVFLEQPEALIEDQQRMLTIEAFGAWFANRFTERVGPDGKMKAVTWAKAWLQSKRRRSYRGVEFHPDPDNAPGTKGYLNLWSGFAVEPAKKPDGARYKTFRDHLLNNVCAGDAHRFKWVMGFFAHMVQRPRERIGTALVLRGKMGSGKTKVGEVIGSLFPRHYFLVDDPRYVTGNFNAHMATCLLLQADEAVWAGDKTAEGRLRGLITSSIQQIEAKGVDPIRLPNYVRLIMTSNEDWVVPAGKDERRYNVLDVDPRCAQNHDYFREMDAELKNGGLAHLLGDLMAFDLNSINLRQVLRTDALLEQKIRSLDHVESWWFDRLMMGATLRDAQAWLLEVPCDTLFGDYIHASDRIGIKRKAEATVFGIKLGKLVPDLKRVRRTVEMTRESDGARVTQRPWCYVLPALQRAREEFERQVNQPVAWPVADLPPAQEGETEEIAL